MKKTRLYQEKQTNIFATALKESQSHESFVTDVIIKAGPEKVELHCHRLVLATSSFFLQTVLSSATPGTIPVIIVPEIQVSVFKLILSYIYNGEVSIPQSQYTDFIEACKMLQLEGPVNDSWAANYSESDEIKEEESDEDDFYGDYQLTTQKMETSRIKTTRQQKKINKNTSGKRSKKSSNYLTQISVTPKQAKAAQKRLIETIRDTYKSLKIVIFPKIEKKISKSKIDVENGILRRGVHECGLCDPVKSYCIRYRYTTTTGHLAYRMDKFRAHLRNEHPLFVGMEALKVII